ncbi:MAG: diguanylate cyclase [Candidatus Firestonebacteria bacterium]
MSKEELYQFKYNFLNLRWLIVIAAAYMSVFSETSSGLLFVNYVNILVLFFIFSNIILYFISLDYFKENIFRYIIFIGDIILVSLGIFFTKSAGTDFFLLYFLVIVITALGKDIKASIIATIVASLLYFWLLVEKDVNIYDVNIYMRIPFLFVVGLFTGFLSETVKKEETHIKDLRLILTITDIMNENIDYDSMVQLLDPLFEKINVITDWEIAVYDKATRKFKFLREDDEISASEMDPEIVDLLINQAKIYKGKSFIYFPQAREKKVTGFLRVKPKNMQEFSEQDYDLFMTLAGEFALVIERNKLYEEIKHLSDLDRLTDLYNYGYFLEQSDIRVNNKKDFAIAMIDLDNFKTYNDTYGHVAGNAYLKNIADNFKSELKDCLLARYGGDEFVVLRDGENKEIDVFLKNFKKAMDTKFVEYEKNIKVTMSIGYALFPKDGNTAEEVLSKSDKSLYKAKQAGKNRIAYL